MEAAVSRYALGIAAETALAHAIDDIVARGECPAFAFEDQQPDGLVGGDLADAGEHVFHHGPRDRVQPLRAVQRERGNPARGTEQNGGFFHLGPSYGVTPGLWALSS